MKTYSYTQSVRNKLALFLLAAAGFSLLTGATMVRADVNRDSETRTESFSYNVEGRTVFLGNLAGEITLSPSSGNKLEITATVVAGGKDAEDNLDLITFEDEIKGKRLELRTVYPTDKYDTYLYDRGYGNSRSSFRYQGDKVLVGSGRRLRDGLEIHVDYDIKLPAGINFTMTNGFGQMVAQGIDGDVTLKNKSGPVSSNNTSGELTLDTGSGTIKGSQHRGDFDADSGSGRVTISDVSGDVGADTGSGSISVENVGGRLNADTGSGSVVATNIGDSANVDTGSGSVTLDDITGSINVDTGSGSINIDDWKGGERLDLDTGSGSIKVRGDFAMVDRLRADTGSGGISLVSTTMPNMKLKASSNSGANIDFPDMTNVTKKRSSFRGTIGSGTGRGEIDSGSGRVSFRLADL